jgi:hypothetical protein
METIFQAPLIWIKVWKKIVENSNLAFLHVLKSCKWEGTRVDFVELPAYKIQLHGTE